MFSGINGNKETLSLHTGVNGNKIASEIWVGANGNKLAWQANKVLFQPGVVNAGFTLHVPSGTNSSGYSYVSNINQLQYTSRKVYDTTGYLICSADLTSFSKVRVRFEFLNVEGVVTVNSSKKTPNELCCSNNYTFRPRLTHNKQNFYPYDLNNGNNAELESIYDISALTGTQTLYFSASSGWVDGSRQGNWGYTLQYNYISLE